MQSIDAKGRSCPEPVILLQKALKGKPDACTIAVDNHAAKENCTRFAKNAGYQVSVAQSDGVYTLSLKK